MYLLQINTWKNLTHTTLSKRNQTQQKTHFMSFMSSAKKDKINYITE